ncbi:MAG: type I glyceraldehyde-3-phosphate dehydrogenase [Syntrophaceae bacterium CG2_30_49_12]|nr:MAG: type I glyceraldehyde-3-phosphate dehydrogenase [Syntrophaceae bacterium CG2_30_49_12]PIP06819.1 MAG: type I glyceraldehyde-3-phosphate dehydrogenase [Syntrophobacterales bacterium CG23_combo_of_CG06-09_8_20_14_all_48_27]PJA48207.1 MAG: type I glyceraldehyde-3-phosphate dehydrogenase [Syntrophobacterales bacterium CG_4_9_14_3_um_filter_49_8]PJC74392.1 MAG: type I glyceraldehyde-3-phosphate dehydrogenase [Syntrophobacterales bacterium CG_4_8_14_3_um_filter_49_14]
MAVKVAINGFGRIGRYLVRACLGYDDIEIVAVNSRAKPDTLAHLLKYDSVHGKIKADVVVEEDALLVNGKRIKITNVSTNLVDLPWGKLGVDIVLESTGKFRKKEEVLGHLTAGAKKVILSATGKGVDGTFVMGVNEDTYDPEKHHIVSNASCTTNCLAPVAKVLHDEFTIIKGLMTTAHSYTMDQRLLDGSHKDLRRARAAAMSIVPTSTGAATAVTEVIPALKGKLDGLALRVPTPNVSLVDLTVEVGRPVTVGGVNGALKAASEGKLKNILAFCEEELVSIDFTSSSYSAIVDAPLTKVIGENFVKVFAWYDNESGYACRMRDLALYMGRKL